MADKVSVDIVVNTQQAKNNLSSFAREIGLTTIGINEAVQAAKAAAAAIGEFVVSSVAAYKEQEQALSNLNAVLKATGWAAGVTSSEMEALASNLQKTTFFGDETTIQAQALLLTFKSIGGDVLPKAVMAAQDMATVMKMDLQQATIMIGKALNEPVQGIGALRRVGVQLTDQQEEMVKQFMEVNDVASAQAVIMQELNSEFGGAAEAAAKTATGSLTQLGNAFSDLKETVGGFIINALEPAIRGLKDLVVEADKAIKKLFETNQNIPWLPNVPGRPGGAYTMGEGNIPKFGPQYNGGALPSIPGVPSKPGAGSERYYPQTFPFNPEWLRTDHLIPSTTGEGEDVTQYWDRITEAARAAEIAQISALQAAAQEAENYGGKVELVVQAVDTWAASEKYLQETMLQTLATSYVDSMRTFGELAYSAGLSVEDLGKSIASMGQQILNMLPQMFLQAGLQAIIMGNIPLGLALIAMAGATGFAAGYTNAAVEDSRSSSKSMAPGPSASVVPSTSINIQNNSGAPATTQESTAPDGSKVVDIIIGQVGMSLARGSYDNIMASRYGVRYSGVRK